MQENLQNSHKIQEITKAFRRISLYLSLFTLVFGRYLAKQFVFAVYSMETAEIKLFPLWSRRHMACDGDDKAKTHSEIMVSTYYHKSRSKNRIAQNIPPPWLSSAAFCIVPAIRILILIIKNVIIFIESEIKNSLFEIR